MSNFYLYALNKNVDTIVVIFKKKIINDFSHYYTKTIICKDLQMFHYYICKLLFT